mmetsp:Transcript_48938/g.79416  ORF Transcript_48938/g.79416 Transcript_48938/m.79416 type:complete len:452 (-) Transcript_48938:81-1436(-)
MAQSNQKSSQEREGEFNAVTASFREADSDNDGTISSLEFLNLLQALQPSAWTEEKVAAVFKAADLDGNGYVDLNELLTFMFGVDKWDLRKYSGKNGDDDSSESGDASSSSSSDSGSRRPSTSSSSSSLGVRKKGRKEDRKQKKAVRNTKNEEPPTNPEEMYELLTMRHGMVEGVLKLQDLVQLFAECKCAGLGPRLAQLVPQDCGKWGREPEDVSALELGHLYALIKENPAATVKDALVQIDNVKEVCRPEVQGLEGIEVSSLGLDHDDAVGFGDFKKMVEFLSAAMLLDQDTILAAMASQATGRFEMTEAMATAVAQRAFLKIGKGDTHVLAIPIKSNDFSRMCFTSNLIDKSRTRGLAQGQIALIFQATIKYMPRHLLARETLRTESRGLKPRKRKHNHISVLGRTQLSILVESLFKELPGGFGGLYKCPFYLSMYLMDPRACHLNTAA